MKMKKKYWMLRNNKNEKYDCVQILNIEYNLSILYLSLSMLKININNILTEIVF